MFWREKMCKFTQIMCNLHKSWSTRGIVDQGSQIHKSHLHKSQNHLRQPNPTHHSWSVLSECIGTQVGQQCRKKFRQVILANWVTIEMGNRKCYVWLCVFWCIHVTLAQFVFKAWEDVGHFYDLCKCVFRYAPLSWWLSEKIPKNFTKSRHSCIFCHTIN